jgi:hypothetical protein
MPINENETIRYDNECVKSRRQRPRWIWEGVVTEGAITLLSAPEKTGKTTLLSLLLDRRRDGGQLLGRRVRPGRTYLCSEEDDNLWALRQPPLEFGPQLEYRRPPGGNPSRRRWRHFIDSLLTMEDHAYGLLVIDTVMNFLPAAQNNPRALRRALEELRVVTGTLTAVLLLHQASAARSRSRTRGPLAAFADILIDMQVPPGDRFTRRRHFYGVGRYPGTLQYAAAELNTEGTDYVVLAKDAPAAELAPVLEPVCQLLRQSPGPLTRQEMLARWPQGESPRADSLWRVLERGCEQGILVRSGEGTRAEAFRYGRGPGCAMK